MHDIIIDYLDQAKVGRKQSYKNLAIYPLLSTYSLSLDYLLLDEALTEGVIDIVEVDKDGSVPELKVINKFPRMVLILDGEELVGAKQNRIVNTTILIQGNSTIVIPVSCVEQGRWSYDSPRFSTKRRVMSPHLRAMKSEQVHYSLRSSGKHRSNQGVIWDEISDKASRHAAESPSMSMAHIYEKDATSIHEYVKHFRLIDSQVGAVFMINGRVVGMDSVGKPETFSKIFKKLVQSYALDAIDWFDPEKEQKALKSEVTKFIKASQAAQVESHPPVGQGIDLRMESKKITGFALSLDDRILHLCIFARENGRKQDKSSSRMERYTQRRRNRAY
jgi:ARG and Rhodanese-Phosphatase-superfamily-associated Protein domain